MPFKPKRPCSHPGCPKLTNGRFCEEHAKQEAARYEKYQRNPAVKKRYGRSWKRVRDRFLTQHPLCEVCQKQGRLTSAEEVHYIVPLSKGGTNATENLMSLCKSCHSAVTAKEGGRWGRNYSRK
ncbi:HNH endonuclease [Desulforamulus hydrothermalis]|uniref:HNH endonuclease n=1 Tax=Desulforamulus hydrothermalis TaxID=412895 RepID=UPI00092350A9|nr:HNH endonuclease [Desulforamulus hydrothermalis]SHG99442.1 5-methylcytosine-specific restriction enzyme A [Desulforamulus hydrothermalis Lam5 = DSM 18033]